jgi:hypothetical protein
MIDNEKSKLSYAVDRVGEFFVFNDKNKKKNRIKTCRERKNSRKGRVPKSERSVV